MLSGGWDAVVRAWRRAGAGLALRGLRAELDHDGRVTALAVRYRKHYLDILSGTSDGDVYLWDYSTKELMNKIAVHPSPVAGICLLSEERIVSASENGDLSVTDLKVLNSVFEKQVSSTLRSVCSDGDVVWAGGAGLLLQMDMLAVRQLGEYEAHQDLIRSIYYDAASKTLTTASDDKSIKVWSLT
ncbi:unnamed protein product [Danaus chrysippus]|uniref:(African queen) hypothetical protein n=1 Tax=Danaus chrysippus TaxID=151541 RepID=A0A8J2QPL3_9NEOP|nr:unnamed protein product [Danaus chrysippus]